MVHSTIDKCSCDVGIDNLDKLSPFTTLTIYKLLAWYLSKMNRSDDLPFHCSRRGLLELEISFLGRPLPLASIERMCLMSNGATEEGNIGS
jgi:hypothetical protein